MEASFCENAKLITKFSDSTSLILHEPENKLYTVKKTSGNRVEYEKLLYVKSPYLAPVSYVFGEGEDITLVRPYIAGDCLADVLKERGKLEKQEAVRLAAEITSGLAVLHREKLVHRDINPNNILVTTEGHAKIIDYGIVRSYEKNKAADTEILGTPGYAAPEQFGFTQSDGKTDLYALGVLLHVMLTGEMPNPVRVGGSIGRIIKKCIHMDAAKRYRSAKQLEKTLWSHVKGYRAGRFFASVPGLRSEYAIVRVFSAALYGAAFLLLMMFMIAAKSFPRFLMHMVSYGFLFAVPFAVWGYVRPSAFCVNRIPPSARIIFSILTTVLSVIIGLVTIRFS